MDDGYVRPGSPLVALMERENLSFVAFSPLAQGRLLGKHNPTNPPSFEEGDHRRGSKAFSAEVLSELEPKIEALRTRFGSSVENLAAMALDYILAQPRVACVIPGFRNERQMLCNLSSGKQPMSPADVQFIRDLFRPS
jgi:aryl-alcohol dehydrogenase-like predicted oxidoreductase